MIKKKWKQITIILLVTLAGFYLFDSWANKQIQKLTYSEFLQAVEQGEINNVVIRENKISGPIVISGKTKRFLVNAPFDASQVADDLSKRGVKIQFGEPIILSFIRLVFASISCLIIFLGLIFLNLYVLKRMKGKTGRTDENNRKGPFKWIY